MCRCEDALTAERAKVERLRELATRALMRHGHNTSICLDERGWSLMADTVVAAKCRCDWNELHAALKEPNDHRPS